MSEDGDFLEIYIRELRDYHQYLARTGSPLPIVVVRMLGSFLWEMGYGVGRRVEIAREGGLEVDFM